MGISDDEVLSDSDNDAATGGGTHGLKPKEIKALVKEKGLPLSGDKRSNNTYIEA